MLRILPLVRKTAIVLNRLLFFLGLLTIHAFAGQYESFLQKLRTAQAIQCRAISSKGETIILTALRNGKFRLETQQRTIVCDGNKIWSYSPSENIVTISTYKATKSVSLERILFELIERYKPSQITESTVTLHPTNQPLYGVQNFTLGFRKSQLHMLTIEHATGTEQWQIHRLRFNPHVSAELFQFTPPAGAEVISDLSPPSSR